MATTPNRKRKSPSKVQPQIEQLRQEADVQDKAASSLVQEAPARQDATTRQKIARYFVLGYFLLFGLILIGYPLYNLLAYAVTGNQSLTIKLGDTIQTFSSVIGPALGFVIGYYFKTNKD